MATYPVTGTRNNPHRQAAKPASGYKQLQLDSEPFQPLMEAEDFCPADSETLLAFAEWERDQAPAARRPLAGITSPP